MNPSVSDPVLLQGVPIPDALDFDNVRHEDG